MHLLHSFTSYACKGVVGCVLIRFKRKGAWDSARLSVHNTIA